MPKLIIPSYISNIKHAQVLSTCIKSLRATTDESVIIVDDCSPLKLMADEVYRIITDKFDNIEIIRKPENTGFSTSVNIGFNRCIEENEDACLVNADIEFKEYGWFEVMQSKEADIVGALLFYPNYLIAHAGIYFSFLTRTFDHRFQGAPPNLPAAHKDCECPVTAALQYIKNEVLQDIGLYDESFKMGYEDVDYMIRSIDKGYRSLYTPDVKAVHHESLFRSEANQKIKDWQNESFMTLIRKWQGKNLSEIAPLMM